MPDDAWSRLAQARRDHAAAQAARREISPGDRGYREAVHRVGTTWAQVRHWERQVERERTRDGPGAG